MTDLRLFSIYKITPFDYSDYLSILLSLVFNTINIFHLGIMRAGFFVFCSSFALPEWAPQSLREIENLSFTIPSMNEAELKFLKNPEEAYDIVSAYYENKGGVPYQIFDGIGFEFDKIFLLFLTNYQIDPVSSYCVKDIPLLWISRPNWYFPTRAEIFSARECLNQGLGLISYCEDWSPECGLFERGLVKLGQALYSRETEEFLRMELKEVTQVDTGIAQFVQEKSWLMDLVEQAYLSESAPRDATERKQAFWIVGNMAHADAFLDRNGYTARSLMVWSALVNNVENDFISAQVIAARPEPFSEAHNMRVKSYFRSMIQNRSEYFGSHPLGPFVLDLWQKNNKEGQQAISACLPTKVNRTGRFTNLHEIGQLFADLENHGLEIFYSCLVTAVLERKIQLLSAEAPEFADSVASFLFMMKMGHDTLAQLK